MKRYRSQLILTSLVLLLPMAAGLLLWSQLPAQIATHFNLEGQADGWSGKAFTVLALPAFLLAIHWICLFATLHDPKKANINGKVMALLFWMVPVISCVTQGVIYANALGMKIDPSLIVNLLLGLIFLLLGNYMGKTHQNYTVGIKLPWTLNSTENWNRTHRLGAKCFVLGGLLLLLNIYLHSLALMLLVFASCILIPTIYSFLLYKKGI